MNIKTRELSFNTPSLNLNIGFENIFYFIYLGGWICHDSSSCLERSIRENKFMSSDNWETVKSVGGILSADPQENPYFADANHVFVPYCSSDSWSGTVSHKNEDGFNFMGRHIVREVIRELSEYQVRLLLFHLKWIGWIPYMLQLGLSISKSAHSFVR